MALATIVAVYAWLITCVLGEPGDPPRNAAGSLVSRVCRSAAPTEVLAWVTAISAMVFVVMAAASAAILWRRELSPGGRVMVVATPGVLIAALAAVLLLLPS